jgi:hypothetical protein
MATGFSTPLILPFSGWVGIEDADDLWEDLNQALRGAAGLS